MDNVPSSIIIFVAAIILTAALGSFFILFYHSNSAVSTKGSSQMEMENLKMKDLQLEKYAGLTMKGSSVLRLIRMMDNKGISIQVQENNKDTYYPYIKCLEGSNTLSSPVGSIKDITKPSELSTSDKTQADRETDYKNAKNGAIDQSEDYECRVLYSESTEAPIGLIFTRSI